MQDLYSVFRRPWTLLVALKVLSQQTLNHELVLAKKFLFP